MSKRTFILKCEEVAEDHNSNDDIINLLTVRILETYLLHISETEIPFGTVADLRKLVSERVLKNSDSKAYSVEIDFENDILV